MTAVSEEEVELRGALEAFDRWERDQWSIEGLDLACDRGAWRDLPRFTATQLRVGIDRFFLGESAVTETLAPIAQAAPTAEARIFLCTQLADEARHTLFFVRYLEAVGEPITGDLDRHTRARWDASAAHFSGLLDVELRRVTSLAGDGDAAAWYRAVALYHLLVEGVLAVAGQRVLLDTVRPFSALTAFRAGILNIARDESRHIGFGVAALAEGVAAGFGKAIADQVLVSLPGSVWILLAPERALPGLLPRQARDAIAEAVERQLQLVRGALLGRLERIGLGGAVEEAASIWERALADALGAYRQMHGRPHPLSDLRASSSNHTNTTQKGSARA
jgi:ribonucleoside-diphosphate reductase beta chain